MIISLIDQIETGVWISKLGRFIPENELWLHQPGSQGELDEAIDWAEKNPVFQKQLFSLPKKKGLESLLSP